MLFTLYLLSLYPIKTENMDKKQPQRLPFSSIREMIQDWESMEMVRPVIGSDYALVYRTTAINDFQQMFQADIPYRVDDFRFLVFRHCDFCVTANLMEHHVVNNTIGFMGTGGILQISKFPEGVEVTGFVLKEDYLRIIMGGRVPDAFNGRVRNFYITVSEEEADMLMRIVRLGYDMERRPDSHQEAVASILAAGVNFVADVYAKYGGGQPKAQSRGQEVFTRFIQLVNSHATHHHSLSYYADRLCITSRYLGTLVQQASGVTAKEWIDRAIVTDAKIALRHSDITVAQLADDLRFPSVSFFCKYFKRLTGMTPVAYRKG